MYVHILYFSIIFAVFVKYEIILPLWAFIKKRINLSSSKWRVVLSTSLPHLSEYTSLLYLLHFRDVTDEGGVVNKVVELLQLAELLHIILPDHLKEMLKCESIKRVHISLTAFTTLHLKGRISGTLTGLQAVKDSSFDHETAGEYITDASGVLTAVL